MKYLIIIFVALVFFSCRKRRLRLEGCEISYNLNPRITTIMDSVYVGYLPNIFSPDSRIIQNSVFGPDTKGMKSMEIKIFKGKKEVFYSTIINDKWDGKFKGTLMKSNVFDYNIKMTSILNESTELKGSVTLLGSDYDKIHIDNCKTCLFHDGLQIQTGSYSGSNEILEFCSPNK